LPLQHARTEREQALGVLTAGEDALLVALGT
jgi:hypothetical protein